MLKTKEIDIKGKRCLVSGSGNVAQYTCEKLLELGAIPVSLSDSDGYIYDPEGITEEKLQFVMELKNQYRGRIREYAEEYGCKFVPGGRPWGEEADIALPSATQNEIDQRDAENMVKRIIAVSEGANMPCTPEAIEVLQKNKVLYARESRQCRWSFGIGTRDDSKPERFIGLPSRWITIKMDHVEYPRKLREIRYRAGRIRELRERCIAGFMKVAKAMMGQGIL